MKRYLNKTLLIILLTSSLFSSSCSKNYNSWDLMSEGITISFITDSILLTSSSANISYYQYYYLENLKTTYRLISDFGRFAIRSNNENFSIEDTLYPNQIACLSIYPPAMKYIGEGDVSIKKNYGFIEGRIYQGDYLSGYYLIGLGTHADYLNKRYTNIYRAKILLKITDNYLLNNELDNLIEEKKEEFKVFVDNGGIYD